MIFVEKKNNDLRNKLDNFIKKLKADVNFNYQEKKGKEIFEKYIDDKNNKTELQKYLLKEQKYLCCYCNVKIKQNNMVIEHFSPKDKHKEKALDYYNLLASCNDKNHCDGNKGNRELKILVSPTNKNIEKYITYNYKAEVKPNLDFLEKDLKLSQTDTLEIYRDINEKLKLNETVLIRARKEKEKNVLQNLNKDRKKKKIAEKIIRNEKIVSFHGYIKWLLKQKLTQ